MILYHGTDEDKVMDILKYGLAPSDSSVTAGASGIYLSRSSSPDYGDGTVLKVYVPDNLKIHPDITQHKDLELMRRRNQYAEEEYGGSRDGSDDFTEEEMDTSGAGDVSDVLFRKGYDGHIDSMVDYGDTVIYRPHHVTVVGIKHADSDEFKPVNSKLNADQFNPFKDK